MNARERGIKRVRVHDTFIVVVVVVVTDVKPWA